LTQLVGNDFEAGAEFADVERSGRFSGMIHLASYHCEASGLPMISLML
jgi:hypothetical protein